ncbi:Ser/Thr protein phosphatase family protein [Streptococcus pneumoniae]|nr:Ser/Thr protein phosphatase family protein [Streptococcus pneumoniae]HES9544678.1 metallophosphoesterase family protein [Streptococcus pneumoniae]HES9558408.1 metallophosphoesterase family protein [Streptococcus pneumoniae]
MNHKIAILSDVHGNATALEAVIADAKNQGASEYWLLGDIFLPGPGANDLVALLKDLPITASVRGNWDDRVLEALDGEYGLEHPQEIQLMRMTQFLMERMDPETIVWLRFSISHNLPNKNYGGDLLVENDTEKFDQLLDAETDVAVYGHVHKQLLRYGSQGQQIINPGTIGMPYFNWEVLKNHRSQYAVIEVEDGELVNILFRKVAYDYEAELKLAKSKGLPFIEMYEELRRDDNYQGHNLELLASLIEKHRYVEDVKNFFDFL